MAAAFFSWSLISILGNWKKINKIQNMKNFQVALGFRFSYVHHYLLVSSNGFLLLSLPAPIHH